MPADKAPKGDCYSNWARTCSIGSSAELMSDSMGVSGGSTSMSEQDSLSLTSDPRIGDSNSKGNIGRRSGGSSIGSTQQRRQASGCGGVSIGAMSGSRISGASDSDGCRSSKSSFARERFNSNHSTSITDSTMARTSGEGELAAGGGCWILGSSCLGPMLCQLAAFVGVKGGHECVTGHFLHLGS